MNKYIANSSATYPLGIPTGRKCLRLTGGNYANRVAIVYAASTSNIVLVWADPPYNSFSSPITLVTDSADKSFDVFMDAAGTIYLAYTVATSNNLAFVKVTFSGGSWSPGSPVTVYNGDDNYCPSIARHSNDEIGIAFTRESGSDRYVNYKKSTDDGSSWGSVSDPGDTLTSAVSAAYAQLIEAAGYLYVFYTAGGGGVYYRRRTLSGSTWESQVTLASGSGFDENFKAAVCADGRIGLAYLSSAGLSFREYSGSAWSVESDLDDSSAENPLVSYQGGLPYVLYQTDVGTGMSLVMMTHRGDGGFTDPEPFDPRKSFLDGLLVYDESAGSMEDKTEAAQSMASADVYHTTSNALLADAGDSVFFGMDQPFYLLSLVLSIAGAGGEVIWRYFDGQTWQIFTPASGAWHFTNTEKAVLLWDDYKSIPEDWQKKLLVGKTLYWVAASVTTAFTTDPVGSQIAAIANLKAMAGQV